MTHLDHLPGLLALEEESLKVYLSILFKQFFNVKYEAEPKSEDDVSKPLFALCSKVLKDYVLKHSELVSINASKKTQDDKGAKRVGQGPAATSEEQLSDLHEKELERQLVHAGPIVHQVILENLMRLQDPELQHYSRDLGQLLIDLTLCNDPQVRLKNHKLLSRIFEQL